MTPSATARSGSILPSAVACRSTTRACRSVARSDITPPIMVAPLPSVVDGHVVGAELGRLGFQHRRLHACLVGQEHPEQLGRVTDPLAQHPEVASRRRAPPRARRGAASRRAPCAGSPRHRQPGPFPWTGVLLTHPGGGVAGRLLCGCEAIHCAAPVKDVSTPAGTPPEAVSPPPAGAQAKEAGGRGATLVGAGILLSRVMGLVRERVFAHYLGNAIPAAAFKAALRIPNFLQNLFGEGVLSGLVHPRLRPARGQGGARGGGPAGGRGVRPAGAGDGRAGGVRHARSRPRSWTSSPRASRARRARWPSCCVRILFPGTGCWCCRAWCLGILNSHRRFFLSYRRRCCGTWRIIATLVCSGGSTRARSGWRRCSPTRRWLGSFSSSRCRCRPVLRAARAASGRRSRWRRRPVRQVLRSFGPVVVGRGVVQISAYVDTAYASLIVRRARCPRSPTRRRSTSSR